MEFFSNSCVFLFSLLGCCNFCTEFNNHTSLKLYGMLVTQTRIQKRTPWRMAGDLMPCWVDQDPVHRFQANTPLHLRRSARHPREPLHPPFPPVSSPNRGWRKENRSTLLCCCKRQESTPLRTHLTKVTKKIKKKSKKKPLLCTQLPSCLVNFLFMPWLSV